MKDIFAELLFTLGFGAFASEGGQTTWHMARDGEQSLSWRLNTVGLRESTCLTL